MNRKLTLPPNVPAKGTDGREPRWDFCRGFSGRSASCVCRGDSAALGATRTHTRKPRAIFERPTNSLSAFSLLLCRVEKQILYLTNEQPIGTTKTKQNKWFNSRCDPSSREATASPPYRWPPPSQTKTATIRTRRRSNAKLGMVVRRSTDRTCRGERCFGGDGPSMRTLPLPRTLPSIPPVSP
jgi:hypothetical protein